MIRYLTHNQIDKSLSAFTFKGVCDPREILTVNGEEVYAKEDGSFELEE